MNTAFIAFLLTGFVALQHLGFLVLEMFLFKGPTGQKVFGLKPDAAELMAPLAANQGLYNGFLAAGLIWSLMAPHPFSHQLAIFFLSCVVIAGLYGGYSVKPTILVIQALPAAIALALWLLPMVTQR